MKKMILLLAIAALGFAGIADATLINRGTDTLGNRLIYDDDLNITWYDYTRSLDTWQNQVNWASSLSVTFGSQTFDDWRLPSTLDCLASWSFDGSTSYGYNNTSSETGHLYYTELGNLGNYNASGEPQSGSGLHNTGEFQHLLPYDFYWSGTEYSRNTDVAWAFDAGYGYQYVDVKFSLSYALAVRPGDVQAAPVPEPGTWLLMGSGLVGLIAARKKFAQR